MNYIHSVWLFPVSLQVPRGSGSGSFRVEKPSDVEIEHVATHYYLRGLCSQRALYASPNPGLSLSAVSSNLLRTHQLKNETISHHRCETLLNHSSLCHFWFFRFQKRSPSTPTSQTLWKRFSEGCQWSLTSLAPTASSGAARKETVCGYKWR